MSRKFILEVLRERERPEGTAERPEVEEDDANNEEFCHFFNNKF